MDYTYGIGGLTIQKEEFVEVQVIVTIVDHEAEAPCGE